MSARANHLELVIEIVFRTWFRAPGREVRAVVMAGVLLAAPAAPAMVIAYENFNYPAGSAANGLNGGFGWNGAWQTSSHFTAQGMDLTINSGDVPVSGAFATLATSGNHLTTFPSLSSMTTGGNGSGVRTFRQVDLARLAGTGLLDPATGKLGAPGTSIWFAMLARLTPGAGNTNGGNGGIHLYDGLGSLNVSPYDGDKPNHERIFMGDLASFTTWYGARTTAGGPGAYKGDSGVSVSTTVRLLVYRFDFHSTGFEVKLFMDPTPGVQPPDSADKLTPAANNQLAFVFDYVEIGTADGSSPSLEKMDIDEIRIATTYAEAVPAATPGTLQFSAASFGVNESGGPATITVTRSGGTFGAVSADFTTTNGSATAPADYSATTTTFSWPDGDSAPKSVLVPIFAESVAEGDETVNLALSNAQGGATLGATSTATLTIHDPPIDAWRFANFGANANNAAIAGDNANPSGDGLLNLTKYVLGLNPNAVASGLGPSASIVQNAGNDYLALTFTRDTSVTDATCVVDQSTDLTQAWNPGSSYNSAGSTPNTAFTIEVSRVPAGASRETIVVRDANPINGSSHSFLRLRAARP
jgi:hypothetical protein